jgi:hypothetical protein
MDIFNIFFDELMQSGPPFFFKVGVRALLPPQKNPWEVKARGAHRREI